MIISPPVICSPDGVGWWLVITVRPRCEAFPTADETVLRPVGLVPSGTNDTSPLTKPLNGRAAGLALAEALQITSTRATHDHCHHDSRSLLPPDSGGRERPS